MVSVCGGGGSVWEGKWGVDMEEGRTRFVLRGGNALFSVNLLANGTVHPGLPLLEGRKTVMNIWRRKFYGRGGR